jgi:Ca2+-transporting ATPase
LTARTPEKPESAISRLGSSLFLAAKTFSRIDGGQRAGAFAFYAFFALFPLVVLSVTVTSLFIDPGNAETRVISYVEGYIPISGETEQFVFDTVEGVVEARRGAGLLACLMLVWSAIQFFSNLIFTTNRAWGTEVYSWWRLPLKSLFLLGILIGAVLAGMALPVIVRMAQNWLLPIPLLRFTYPLWNFVLPSAAVFLCLSLFYSVAPRRSTRFSEVWVPALFATVLLRTAESFFVIYLERFATFNVVYGAFGGIMALLLWIYLSGWIIIFGVCLCAARGEEKGE